MKFLAASLPGNETNQGTWSNCGLFSLNRWTSWIMHSGDKGHYSVVTLKAHLFHLTDFNPATLSAHYADVHGWFTGCDNSLNLGDVLQKERTFNVGLKIKRVNALFMQQWLSGLWHANRSDSNVHNRWINCLFI